MMLNLDVWVGAMYIAVLFAKIYPMYYYDM